MGMTVQMGRVGREPDEGTLEPGLANVMDAVARLARERRMTEEQRDTE